ncbi:MAG: nuclear transport factor 2 family protein [Actinomycetota bacterium]|nr:nuclear transport factor 2 family protein [Actinomycetota bacterium]
MTGSDAARNESTIRRLYGALDEHDGETMAACYSDDAAFSDPAFPDLRGSQPGDMWRMLTSRATDLSCELAEVDASETSGHAVWIATYTFGETGRKVVNRVRSEFEFDDVGLISRQRDEFPFWTWSRQALGLPGAILGWTPILRAKVQSNAAAQLARFRADHRNS